MELIAVVAVVGMAVACVSAVRAVLSLERRHARHVDTLLDRLAHANGRTWTPPPVEDTNHEGPPVHVDVFADPDQEL